jgi:hypothetical protein
MRHFHYLVIGVFLAFSCFVPVAGAAILFESGTLGPTGVTWDDLLAEAVGGTGIRSAVFTGVKFELHQPVVTTQIGGHFLQRPGSDPNGNGSFFGAIVALEDENDFPNSGDLSTSDVLGSTLLSFPDSSNEVLGDLTLSLNPGWYALVFGSGLFGATAEGTAIRNNPDIEAPTYIGWQPGAVLGWGNLINPIFRNHRFVVLGEIVPEPSTIIMAFSVSSISLLWRARKH